jgi:hypothetical protein
MDDKLRRSLQHLHDELGRARPQDDPARQRVQQLQGDIRSALDRPALPEHVHSLAERVREEVSTFEGHHPNLTGAAEAVIDQLARMGI